MDSERLRVDAEYWDKVAVEGATHYVPGSCYPWEKRVGNTWFYYNDEDSNWVFLQDDGDVRLASNTGKILEPFPRPTPKVPKCVYKLYENGSGNLVKAPGVGTKWEHHSGRVYRVVMIANANTERPEEYPITVVYENVVNGTTWSRPASDWSRSFIPYDQARKDTIKDAFHAVNKKELATCEWRCHAERIIHQLYDGGMLKKREKT